MDVIQGSLINSINIAIDLGKTTEVIRLLLLSQRIEFRYDSVFAENAFELAEAMIALGKPEAAYNYLVRENTLLTTEFDSIYFLQLFYENGYIDVDHALYEKIDAKLREILNRKEFSTQTFLMQLYLQTQLCNEGEIGVERFQNIVGALRRFEKDFESDDEDEGFLNAIKFVKEYGVADSNAFFIRRFNKYVTIKDLTSIKEHYVNKLHIKIVALALLKYAEQNNMFNYIGKNNAYVEAIEDLTISIKNYKFDYTQEELYILLLALIEDSRDSKTILDLIDQYQIEFPNLNLRQENGVDVNFDSIHRYWNIKMFIGYNEDENSFPQITYNDSQWEKYAMSLIESIALLKGCICRLVADNTEKPYTRLLYIISKINFSFDARSKWKRSYHIPESIFPYIYAQIAQLYVDFSQIEYLTL